MNIKNPRESRTIRVLSTIFPQVKELVNGCENWEWLTEVAKMEPVGDSAEITFKGHTAEKLVKVATNFAYTVLEGFGAKNFIRQTFTVQRKIDKTAEAYVQISDAEARKYQRYEIIIQRLAPGSLSPAERATDAFVLVGRILGDLSDSGNVSAPTLDLAHAFMKDFEIPESCTGREEFFRKLTERDMALTGAMAYSLELISDEKFLYSDISYREAIISEVVKTFNDCLEGINK